MSVARVQHVDHSMKEYTCDKCGAVIPKRTAYRHYKVGFRSRHKYVRCMKSECTPRPSELESSLLSGAYAAVEAAEDDIGSTGTASDIEDAMQAAADGIREVAQQYRDAAEAMGDAGADMEERADNLESAADELEGHQIDEIDEDEEDEDCPDCSGTGKAERWVADSEPERIECTECGGTGKAEADPDAQTAEELLEEAKEAALEVLGGVEL